MPHISGQQLTTLLRRNPKTALIPIIMVSAQAGTEARAEALEGGVDDYLVKPFQARELLARARVHLQLGLMRNELSRRVEERTRALMESDAQNRALAERYSMLSTVSPVGVIEIDEHGEIVYGRSRLAAAAQDPSPVLTSVCPQPTRGGTPSPVSETVHSLSGSAVSFLKTSPRS